MKKIEGVILTKSVGVGPFRGCLVWNDPYTFAKLEESLYPNIIPTASLICFKKGIHLLSGMYGNLLNSLEPGDCVK